MWVAKVILVPWLAVCGHAVWKQGIVASGKGKEFRTSDNEFKVGELVATLCNNSSSGPRQQQQQHRVTRESDLATRLLHAAGDAAASGHPRRAAGSQGAPPAASISELDSQPLDPLPQVMWRQESAAGEFLSVVQGDHTKARFQLLKAGHSILGGRYTLPSYFANQSIYDVFYIHEGVRCGCCSRYSADARLRQSDLLCSAKLFPPTMQASPSTTSSTSTRRAVHSFPFDEYYAQRFRLAVAASKADGRSASCVVCAEWHRA